MTLTAKKTGKHRATVARKAARAKKVAVLPDIVGTSLDKGALGSYNRRCE